eukprot:5041297-Alexandrium_andersonii.AAC.1
MEVGAGRRCSRRYSACQERTAPSTAQWLSREALAAAQAGERRGGAAAVAAAPVTMLMSLMHPGGRHGPQRWRGDA